MADKSRQQGGSSSSYDKDMEMVVTAISAKLDDVKGSLSNFVGKMEHENLTWPSVLNSFAALSGQMSTLMKQLTSDKLTPMYQYLLLPKQVSSERDPELEKVTEGRVPILHHEVLPDYFRTKLDLDLESQHKELYRQAANIPHDFEDEVSRYNEALDTVLMAIDEANEEKQKHKVDTVQPTSFEDTKRLVAAYLNCTGLQQMSANRRAMLIGRPLNHPQQMVHPHHQQPGPMARTNTLSRVAPPTRPMHPPQPHIVPHPQAGFTGSPYKK